MSAVVSTVALNVQSDGSVAVKIDVVPSSRAPSPLLEMLGGAAAEATNLALAFVDDAAEATSAVASAGAALAGTAETLFDAAADRVDADVASTIRVFNPFMAMAMSGFNAFVDNAASGALTAHVGAIVKRNIRYDTHAAVGSPGGCVSIGAVRALHTRFTGRPTSRRYCPRTAGASAGTPSGCGAARGAPPGSRRARRSRCRATRRTR